MGPWELAHPLPRVGVPHRCQAAEYNIHLPRLKPSTLLHNERDLDVGYTQSTYACTLTQACQLGINDVSVHHIIRKPRAQEVDSIAAMPRSIRKMRNPCLHMLSAFQPRIAQLHGPTGWPSRFCEQPVPDHHWEVSGRDLGFRALGVYGSGLRGLNGFRV